MTRQELRVFIAKWFCGCASPEEAAGALLRLLRLHPLYEHHAEFEEWITDSGIAFLLLYTLDRFELTEHGGTIEYGWLTDKGKAVLSALDVEEGDGFEGLFAEHCACGYDLDDQDHDCFAASAEHRTQGKDQR